MWRQYRTHRHRCGFAGGLCIGVLIAWCALSSDILQTGTSGLASLKAQAADQKRQSGASAEALHSALVLQENATTPTAVLSLTPTPIAPSVLTAGNVAAAGSRRRPPKLAIVVNANDYDDVVWLLRYFSDSCIIAYQHNPAPYSPFDAGPNKGAEQTTLLRFIIDHYDNLPRHTIFLHGARESWHTSDMVPMIRRIRWELLRDDAFVNLNYLADRGHWANNILFQRIGDCPTCSAPDQFAWIQKMWPELYEPWLGPFNITRLPYFDTYCCLQVIIGRAALRRHPKALYEHMFAFLQREPNATLLQLTPGHDKVFERVIEHTWRFVITGEHNYTRLPTREEEMCRYVECPLDPLHYFDNKTDAPHPHLRHPAAFYPCEPDDTL